jgi:site-specific DNA-methyltransferase (adenine-specific)
VNTLYYGDNAHWLPRIADGTIDLVYLDPPFNSKATYNILYRSPDGSSANAQYQAFMDTWSWGPAADSAFRTVMRSGSPAAGLLGALQNFLQKSDLMAYLSMMTARLIELHRVLTPAGSLYLHCDSTASHYLKILLDAIFGEIAFAMKLSGSAHMPTVTANKVRATLAGLRILYCSMRNPKTRDGTS